MGTLILYLKTIPLTIWSAIIASFITLLGVAVNNRSNNKRLIKQLEHDSKIKDREREMLLRREVFLQAAEGLTSAQNFMMRLPNIDIQKSDLISPLELFSKALAKIDIIASIETIINVKNVAQEYSKSIIYIYLKRIPILKLEDDIKDLDLEIKSFENYSNEILSNIKSLGNSGNYSEELYKKLSSQSEDCYKRTIEKINEREAKNKIKNELLILLLSECIDITLKISDMVCKANIEIRKELEIPLNKEKYLTLNEELKIEAKQCFDNFILQLKKEIQG